VSAWYRSAQSSSLRLACANPATPTTSPDAFRV
jgi:hypothetical protein